MGVRKTRSIVANSWFFYCSLEAAAAVVEGKGLDQVEPQVIDSITQALKGLKEGSDNLRPMMGPDDMANMFNGLDMGDVNFLKIFKKSEIKKFVI